MQDLQASNTKRASSGSRKVDEKAGEKNENKEKDVCQAGPIKIKQELQEDQGRDAGINYLER